MVCEASGMLGQQYVESMVWEVSEWCMRSAVCCVSGVGAMVCMVSYMSVSYTHLTLPTN